VQHEREKPTALRRFVVGFERSDNRSDFFFAERIKRVGEVSLREEGRREKTTNETETDFDETKGIHISLLFVGGIAWSAHDAPTFRQNQTVGRAK
jgi:hypothetical protein